MPNDPQRVLTINGGSSSIKFALFEVGRPPRRVFSGVLERIGRVDACLRVKERPGVGTFSKGVTASDHHAAVGVLMDWLEKEAEVGPLAAVGHRVVHGGPEYSRPQRVTPEMLQELRRIIPFDPDHLPEEILLTEEFEERFPGLPQIACFDTAFHRDMPRVAKILSIPRRYEEKGIVRYGFHGLSYAYLMRELERTAGAEAAQGRVVLAHLGGGASLAAVRGGQSIDTSMGFTPAAGIPMGTRSGDIDPGLVWYLFHIEGADPKSFNTMINQESGLLGVSGTSADMRDLMEREAEDPRAADAVALFCYQVKKYIGAFAAALGGLDTLVFSGGIGENSPEVRSRVCEGLGFLGVELDEARNKNGGTLVSRGKVAVRVIPTDEERMIAETVCEVLELREE